MKKYTLFVLVILFPLIAFSQIITKQNELFSNIQEVKGKVVFIREITVSTETTDAYMQLENWGKKHYGKTPFISSIKYDKREKEIITQSKVELILPKGNKNIDESILMKYKLDAYISKGKCIIEISDIWYYPTKNSSYTIGKSINAEMFLPKDTINTNTVNEELQIRTKKATIFFFNKLSKSLDNLFGHQGNEGITESF